MLLFHWFRIRRFSLFFSILFIYLVIILFTIWYFLKPIWVINNFFIIWWLWFLLLLLVFFNDLFQRFVVIINFICILIYAIRHFFFISLTRLFFDCFFVVNVIHRICGGLNLFLNWFCLYFLFILLFANTFIFWIICLNLVCFFYWPINLLLFLFRIIRLWSWFKIISNFNLFIQSFNF